MECDWECKEFTLLIMKTSSMLDRSDIWTILEIVEHGYNMFA